MFDIEIQKNKGLSVIDSRLLHKGLEVKSYHADWIRRRIDNYGFEEKKDYFLLLKNENQKGSGGHNAKTYLLTLDMAKELCMLENTDKGKATRRYFIKAEKQLRKHEVVRLATIEARKTLTEAIDEAGENERMHGHGYSTYTKLAYELSGLKDKYKSFKQSKAGDNFRDVISEKELKRLEGIETLIRTMVDADKKYLEIKESLKPLFENKNIKELGK